MWQDIIKKGTGYNKTQDHKIILLHLKKALAICLQIIKDSF